MADHWVAEVFPPRFQFQSVDEMLNNSGGEKKGAKVGENLCEVYRRVLMEFEPAETLTTAEEEICNDGTDGHHTMISDKDQKKNKRGAKTDVMQQDDCIWNEKELRMLRKFLQKAKMQNLKLAVLLESAQKETDSWKQKYREAAKGENVAKSSLYIFRKKYERLKVTYKALKEDMRKYHANLKFSRNDCKELRTERSELVKAFNQAKAELDSERIEKEKFQLEVNDRDKYYAEVIEDRENLITQQYSLEVTLLKREIDKLKKELVKAKQDNSLNKKALEHLRRHFANLRVDSEPKLEHRILGDVLSVIDIEYLPK